MIRNASLFAVGCNDKVTRVDEPNDRSMAQVQVVYIVQSAGTSNDQTQPLIQRNSTTKHGDDNLSASKAGVRQ